MMSNVTLDQVIRMVDQLDPSDRVALVNYLQSSEAGQHSQPLTLDMIIAERKRRLVTGEFEHAISILGRFAKPDLDLSADELEAGIKGFATEWEQELDDYKPN